MQALHQETPASFGAAAWPEKKRWPFEPAHRSVGNGNERSSCLSFWYGSISMNGKQVTQRTDVWPFQRIESPCRMNFHIVPDTGSVARQVEKQLRASIIAMDLLPGAKLSEQDIAERFGISRQPVREALISLAKAELVAILPQRGTVVVKISAARMMQAQFIREQIEAGVVRRACSQLVAITDQQTLQALIDQQSASLLAGDVAGFKLADERFHQQLADAAGVPLAWQTIGDIKSHLDRVCHLTLRDAAALTPLIAHHQAILDAIIARNADGAEAAMRFHLTEIVRALPTLMASRSDLFV
ncbi:MAG: GntR family transcriptional regulator [Beijerinckiaceae bacterium]